MLPLFNTPLKLLLVEEQTEAPLRGVLTVLRLLQNDDGYFKWQRKTEPSTPYPNLDVWGLGNRLLTVGSKWLLIMQITTTVGLSLDQPVFPGPIKVTSYDPVEQSTGVARPTEPIKFGDTITNVDGQDLRALPLDLVKRFIEKPTANGASKDKVELTIRRNEETFLATLPRPPAPNTPRARKPNPYIDDAPLKERNTHDSFSSSYSRSSAPPPEAVRAEPPRTKAIQHLSPTTVEIRHETLEQQRNPDYIPTREVRPSAIMSSVSQPSGTAVATRATAPLAQTGQRVHVTKIETPSYGGRVSGDFVQSSPSDSSLAEGRMLRSRIIPRKEWATIDTDDGPEVDVLRASGALGTDQASPPPRWAEATNIAPVPMDPVKVTAQHLSPGNRLTPASTVENSGVGTTFVDATGTAYVKGPGPPQRTTMASTNDLAMGQGWYTSAGYKVGDKNVEGRTAIGFLLGQKVAGGDIVIEDIGDEGMASKMLRHPAISVQKGDIIMEVDGQAVSGMACKDVADLIRDPWEETPNATIVVYRPSSGTNVTVVLPRPPRTRDLDDRRREGFVTPRNPAARAVRQPAPEVQSESESGLPWEAPKRRGAEVENQQMLQQRSSVRSTVAEEDRRLKATNEILVERELERRRLAAQKNRQENEHKNALKMLKDLETCFSNIGVAIRRDEFDVAYQWLNMAGALAHKAGVHGAEGRLAAAREYIAQAQRENEDSQLEVEQIGPNWSIARAKPQPGPQDSANSFKFYPPAFSPRNITGQTIVEEISYRPETSYEPPPFRPPSPVRTDLLLESVIANEDEASLKEAMSIQRELLVLDALEQTLAEAAREELERKSEAVMKLYIVDDAPTPTPLPVREMPSSPSRSPPVKIQASFTNFQPPPPQDTTKPFNGTEQALDKEKLRLMQRVLSASFDDEDDDTGSGTAKRKVSDSPDVFRYAGV